MNRTPSHGSRAPKVSPLGSPLLAPCELAQPGIGDLIVALVFQPHL